VTTSEPGQPGAEGSGTSGPPVAAVSSAGDDAVRVEFRIEDLVATALAKPVPGDHCSGCAGCAAVV
jgi:hypothetical protein